MVKYYQSSLIRDSLIRMPDNPNTLPGKSYHGETTVLNSLMAKDVHPQNSYLLQWMYSSSSDLL